MSADNGVYILKTKTQWQIDPKSGCQGSDHTTRPVWRVAHTQGIDSIDWYQENELYNFGAYLLNVWDKSPKYLNKEEAWTAARNLAEKYDYLEYGIQEIDLSDFQLLGD